MPSPTEIPLQEPYIRTREHPYFDGLFRGDNASKNQEFQGNGGSWNLSRTASDISDARSKSFIESISEKSMEDSPTLSDSAFDKLPEISQVKSFAFSSSKSDLSEPELGGDTYESYKEPPSLTISADIEEYDILSNPPVIEKCFRLLMNQNKHNLLGIPLPQSAASFYNVLSPQVEIVELCESTKRLNLYLQARKEDARAGFPGSFLHAVIAPDISGFADVGSVASTIMYAYYLNQTLGSDQLCTVPVISMKRTDLDSHVELKWLLDSCQIDDSSLIFLDEIDLTYYNLFGSLKLVLVNGHKLPSKLEALKEAVVEIFNCRKDEPATSGVRGFTTGEDSSCCTLIAEKFSQTSPEILAGQGFSRLLLAGILLDTGNLTNPNCTAKDRYMATLLINGAGRFGSNGLHQLLRYKMYDVSDLRVVDILRKDFKKWTRVGKADSTGSRSLVSYVGMSSIGIPIEQLLVHGDNSAEEIKYFQQLEKLRLLMIVSGYYDSQKNFKREMLVAAASVEHMKSIVLFFNSHLPLKAVDRRGLKEEMRVFKIDKVISRKTIELLIEEFDGASRA